MCAQRAFALKSKLSSNNTIIRDFKNMDREEFQRIYGVTAGTDDDTTIFDPAYQKTFKDVHAWVAFSEEQEEGDVGGCERISARYGFGDDD